MRTLPAGLASHVALDRTTLAYGLRIVREDGAIYAWTSADADAVIGGITYDSAKGFIVTSLVTSEGFAVGNLELRTLHDGSVFTTTDVLNGVWRNAAFTVFQYNFENLADGVDTLLAGTVGEVEIQQEQVVLELRDLRQYLQQPVGSPSSKTCRYRLGDSLCRVPIDGSPTPYLMGSPGIAAQVIGSVTSVVDAALEFVDTARTAEPSDWYGEGEIEWLTGGNAGARRKIKSFAFTGSPADTPTFTLALPMFAPILVGDTYRATVGCRKRLEEDCRDKFDNVVNFGGEPHRPTVDDLTKPIRVSV